jgi:hypothetical protein
VETVPGAGFCVIADAAGAGAGAAGSAADAAPNGVALGGNSSAPMGVISTSSAIFHLSDVQSKTNRN